MQSVATQWSYATLPLTASLHCFGAREGDKEEVKEREACHLVHFQQNPG